MLNDDGCDATDGDAPAPSGDYEPTLAAMRQHRLDWPTMRLTKWGGGMVCRVIPL